MNCPVCTKPMATRTKKAYRKIHGVRHAYYYSEMYCDDHPQQSWQTETQLQANLDAIKAIKEAAEKLKKATK